MSDEHANSGEWTVRKPEGYYDAIQATGTTVAPILAGFAFAVLALVLVPPAKNGTEPLRWRDPALALLVLSALIFIICTQAAIRARATMVKPDELRAWYPSSVDCTGWPNQWLATRQKNLERRTAQASSICRHTYNAGILLFFTAIAVLVVPPNPVDDTRRAVLSAAAIAVAVEAAWLTGTSLRQKSLLERLPTLLTPASYALGSAVILCISHTGAARAAAATGIAIAATAAAAASIRLTTKGKHCQSRAVGIVMLVTTLSAAACATTLLLNDWRHATLLTDITVAALVFTLMAAVFPGGQVTGPDGS